VRVLILTHHYPPEVGAPQTRLSESARVLRSRGHDVSVLTALPSYPDGVVPSEYRGQHLIREQIDGVSVVRAWTYANPSRSARSRLANQLSFAATALTAARSVGRPDVILVESPPLFLGPTGVLLGLMLGSAVALHVADLWPDVAEDLGALSDPRARAVAHTFERIVYAYVHRVIVVTPTWATELHRRGVPGGKIDLVTNGVDPVRLDRAAHLDSRRRLRVDLALEGRTVVACVGTVGNVYDYELLLAVAERLRAHDDIRMLIVGGGSRGEWIRGAIEQRGLANVILLPALPRDAVPPMLAAADISLVGLRPLPVTRGILPVRILEAMAASLPVIAAGHGESRRVIASAGCGVAVEPGDVDGMTSAILELAADAERRRELGGRGRATILAEYSRERVALQLEAALQRTLATRNRLGARRS
jgi:glycosyltransferase involved in cell wall biosynthesis